jgi:hypothetical protein
MRVHQLISTTAPYPHKPTLLSTLWRRARSEWMVNRAIVPLSQGVRHHAEGCIALGWELALDINDPFRALGSAPFCLCLPPIWGAVGGDFLDYLWDHKWTSMEEKEVLLKTLKDRTPLQGDPNKTSIDRGPKTWVLHQQVLVQPANL